MTVDEVRAAAMRLERDELAALAADLLDVVDRPPRAPQAEVDAAWSVEIGRRLDLVAGGNAKGLTMDEVEARLHAVVSSVPAE